MKKIILTSIFATVMLQFVSCNGNAQTKTTAVKSNATAAIQVI